MGINNLKDTNLLKAALLFSNVIKEISFQIRSTISNFSKEDTIIFNDKLYQVDSKHFKPIVPNALGACKIAYIDGGSAEILKAGNFCLSFIRVAGVIFENNAKKHITYDFFLFTKAVWDNELYYESEIFSDNKNTKITQLINACDLRISSKDATIRTGRERAPITKIIGMARRFAELALAASINANFILLDGSLEATYPNEELYLSKLGPNVCALAKSSSLFTTSGNSPVVLLNKIGPHGAWYYELNEICKFVKLHESAKHVFRFDGNSNFLSELINNCYDSLFLGYPYGLLLVDKIARVSNQEKTSLTVRFLLNQDNSEIAKYLKSVNAHNILDNLG